MKPFCIIRSHESSRFFDNQSKTYYKVTMGVEKYRNITRYKSISREEAREIVRKNGLVEVLTNEHGRV